MTHYNPVNPSDSIGRIVRIAHNTVNPDIRGKHVSIVGVRGATHFDGTRVIVRLVNSDGSLGAEYLVTPGLIVENE